ncbi:MAG TPA: exodeoxyribonuclease VII large subunit [Gammaproteobacteria bacterium]|nr:exodeoxyribonuclease VII large subunit [Gammaproteobacteria bacterium]
MQPGDTLELDFGASRNVLTVSQLNRQARTALEGAFATVWVEGEISNLSRPSSGHFYFSLKDPRAQVRCAMFRMAARQLQFELDNGLHVLVRARVSFYEARGEFQLVVDDVEEAGEGLLRRRFEALKRKLAAEGLFDSARKRPLPRVPRRIGVVTSPTGAAIRDVLTALKRRFPTVGVLIYPTSVQGAGAAEEIRRALALAERRRECDVLILTRGGGSLEDLWAFNEEIVARAVAAVTIPIIVGVGHETDFTIADFAADLRAPTPSQAAELAVPDRAAWLARLGRSKMQLGRAVLRCVAADRRRLDVLCHRLERCHPGVVLRQLEQRLDDVEVRMRRCLVHAVERRKARLGRLAAAVSAANPKHRLAATAGRLRWSQDRLQRAVARRLERLTHRLAVATRTLNSLSPLATLDRGYAIVERDGGRVVTDSSSVSLGESLRVRLTRGRLGVTVDRKDDG